MKKIAIYFLIIATLPSWVFNGTILFFIFNIFFRFFGVNGGFEYFILSHFLIFSFYALLIAIYLYKAKQNYKLPVILYILCAGCCMHLGVQQVSALAN